MRVLSLKMAILVFASFVHCLPNILHTWPHDSLYVMRLSSMTLGDISRSLDCFISNFSRTVRDTVKVTIDYKSYSSFRLVSLLMTLNDI